MGQGGGQGGFRQRCSGLRGSGVGGLLTVRTVGITGAAFCDTHLV